MNALETLKVLAGLAHHLRESSASIDEGIRTHGTYSVPWNVLSFARDIASRTAEVLADFIGPVCPTCDGLGFHANPAARYYYDHDTGMDSTNDPEEIDCETCGGLGFCQPQPPEPTRPNPEAIEFPKINDEDLPF